MGCRLQLESLLLNYSEIVFDTIYSARHTQLTIEEKKDLLRCLNHCSEIIRLAEEIQNDIIAMKKKYPYHRYSLKTYRYDSGIISTIIKLVKKKINDLKKDLFPVQPSRIPLCRTLTVHGDDLSKPINISPGKLDVSRISYKVSVGKRSLLLKIKKYQTGDVIPKNENNILCKAPSKIPVISSKDARKKTRIPRLVGLAAKTAHIKKLKTINLLGGGAPSLVNHRVGTTSLVKKDTFFTKGKVSNIARRGKCSTKSLPPRRGILGNCTKR